MLPRPLPPLPLPLPRPLPLLLCLLLPRVLELAFLFCNKQQFQINFKIFLLCNVTWNCILDCPLGPHHCDLQSWGRKQKQLTLICEYNSKPWTEDPSKIIKSYPLAVGDGEGESYPLAVSDGEGEATGDNRGESKCDLQ